MQRHNYRTPKQVRDEWDSAMMNAAYTGVQLKPGATKLNHEIDFH